MKASRRRAGVWAALLVLVMAAPALAQENIDAGKTPAQLYAQDCAICHKTPHGLSKAGGVWGLQGFLREHYTASRESAAAIAAYLIAIDRKAPDRKRMRARSHPSETATPHRAGARLPPHRPALAKAEEKAKAPAKPKAEAKPESQTPKAAAAPAAKPQDTEAGPELTSKPEDKAGTKAADKPESKSEPVEAKAEAKSETETKTGSIKEPGAKSDKKPD